jgi:hypothetical protein
MTILRKKSKKILGLNSDYNALPIAPLYMCTCLQMCVCERRGELLTQRVTLVNTYSV